MLIGELEELAELGEIDTVIIGFCDMQGRLQGKRLTARNFLDEIAENGGEGCEYLLAVDVEMNTVDGYDHASWDTGYGDFVFRPDLSTLRRIPWHEATALCFVDVVDHHGADVAISPRAILRRQLDRLAERGLFARSASELEFIVFEQTYEEAWDSGYRDLVPVNRYNTDYSILGSSRVEPLMRRIRNEMPVALIPVENSKGECNLGQQEVTLHHAPSLTMADNHTLYKHGVKEIASQLGISATFMAKYNEAEGNSCHVHISLETEDGSNAFAADEAVFNSFLQGLIVTLRELTLLHAPQINSYKRFQKASFAPTAVAWGEDNRTCALRTVGHDRGRRIELRVPGADVNPYLTVAGIIAGGLHGIENELQLEPETTGNGYLTDSPHVPSTLAEARDLFAASAIASEAFGEEVVAHYVNCAQVEIDAFNSAVTDWELKRGFERL